MGRYWRSLVGGFRSHPVSVFLYRFLSCGKKTIHIFSFGINIGSIFTLPINTPAISYHLGIVFDVDLAKHFPSQYSEVTDHVSRMLSSGNKRSIDSYLSYVTRNINHHKLLDRTRELYDELLLDPSSQSSQFSKDLNALDHQFTEILQVMRLIAQLL
jgi:hypothetical protein